MTKGINKTFLVVDDDPVFNRVLSKALENRDFNVLSAHSLSEAESAIQTQTPDYATIDLKLEQDSGLQLIPLLRKRFPEINMLVLTGYASIPTTVEAIKLGANNYLCKPANTSEILQALSNSEEQKVEPTAAEATPLSVEQMEWEHIQRVLSDNNDNISATARVLGMHRRTLQRKLQKHTSKH